MSFSGRQRVLLETNMARDRAEALLASLLNAQRAVDREAPPQLTGDIVSRASMDRAIGATKRTVELLSAALEQAARDLDDESLAELDELLDEAAAGEPAPDGAIDDHATADAPAPALQGPKPVRSHGI